MTIKHVFVVLALGVLLTGCFTGDSAAQTTLEGAGFTDITLKGTGWFTCSEDDRFGKEFTAKNAQGKPVSGAVCCGRFFKGCTIRF